MDDAIRVRDREMNLWFAVTWPRRYIRCGSHTQMLNDSAKILNSSAFTSLSEVHEFIDRLYNSNAFSDYTRQHLKSVLFNVTGEKNEI